MVKLRIKSNQLELVHLLWVVRMIVVKVKFMLVVERMNMVELMVRMIIVMVVVVAIGVMK